MILTAKHHSIIYPFFRFYTGYLIRRNFSQVHIIGECPDRKLPILLIANHVSWWDGFWCAYINFNIYKRKFHFMMFEEQLRRYWFFNYTGGYSVNKRSRSMLESIRYTNSLLTDNRNMVLIFPQGEIRSAHAHDIVFERGIEKILADQKNPVQVIFQVNLTDYFSEKKPGLYLYLKEYNDTSFQLTDLQHSYNCFFSECINAQQSIKG